LQTEVTRERDRLKLLLDVNNAVVSNLSLTELFKVIPHRVRLAMQCDGACLSLPDLQKQQLEIHGLDFPEGRGFLQEETQLPIDGSSPGKAFRTGEPVLFETAPRALHVSSLQLNFQEGVQSGCFLPLVRGDRKIGVLHLLDRHPHRFSEADADFLQQVSNQVAIALDNAMQYREVDESRERLAGETSYLRTEIRAERGFDEILGNTPAIQEVLRLISTVAPTNSTVLIQGETGTGKELVARAIHNLSSRRENLFAKLNCAAIPSGLLESELFGHEKGAFTGAIAKKAGRFEVADKGTLFSMKSATSLRNCSPSCCASCRSRSSSASAAVARSKLTFGSWPLPIRTWEEWWRIVPFAPTSTTGSTFFPSGFLPCANAGKIFPCLSSTLWSTTASR
jgi:formate hydrogenlyase transcriptional activator